MEYGIWKGEGGRGIVYLSVTGSKSEAGENSTGKGSWGISCFFATEWLHIWIGDWGAGGNYVDFSMEDEVMDDGHLRGRENGV